MRYKYINHINVSLSLRKSMVFECFRHTKSPDHPLSWRCGSTLDSPLKPQIAGLFRVDHPPDRREQQMAWIEIGKSIHRIHHQGKPPGEFMKVPLLGRFNRCFSSAAVTKTLMRETEKPTESLGCRHDP